ncbi:MAG: alpha/beta hydrolase [Gemmatimonadetes bacterium]|nr:alpha/beta hydrolase [Gemmatimonadota bacterium]
MNESAQPPVLRTEPISAAGTPPERWVAILHGIFGAGRNWTTVARRLVRARPEWGALIVDLRQHGGSRGFAPPHTLAAAAADLPRAFAATGLPVRAVLGHSFGGKVALELVRSHAESLALESLWLVDSPPGAHAPGGSAWEVLEALRRAPGPFPGREAGVSALRGLGVAEGVARWMTTNLEERSNGWVWRIDPEDMEQLLGDFFRQNLWGVVENPPPGLDLHVVKADESSALDEEACRRVEAAVARSGRVHLHRVAGGHWVNADNPDAMLELLESALP